MATIPADIVTEASRKRAKKPKVSLPLAQRKRHNTLWFEDGSVVLSTPDVLFRVFRSTLSRHSPIFRDMFSLPQSSNVPEEETMDGVPVVELHDDPEDLAHLLSALHDPL